MSISAVDRTLTASLGDAREVGYRLIVLNYDGFVRRDFIINNFFVFEAEHAS